MTPLPTVTLYELRTQAGFATQAAIAVRLGVCTDTYAGYERGKHRPSPARVRKLARLLRVREALLWQVLR